MTINAIPLKCYFMFSFILMFPSLLSLWQKQKKRRATVAYDSLFLVAFFFFVVVCFLFCFLCVCLCLQASRLWDCVSCSLIYVRKYSKQHSGTLLLPSFLSPVWELFRELVKIKNNWCTEKKKVEIFISTRLVPGGATSPKYQALRELFLYFVFFFFCSSCCCSRFLCCHCKELLLLTDIFTVRASASAAYAHNQHYLPVLKNIYNKSFYPWNKRFT